MNVVLLKMAVKSTSLPVLPKWYMVRFLDTKPTFDAKMRSARDRGVASGCTFEIIEKSY